MIVLITLLSLFQLIAADTYGLPLIQVKAQIPVPVPVYAPPPVVAAAPVPHRVIVKPAAVYGVPEALKEGLEIKSGKIPDNTQISVQDKAGQYSHGFNTKGTQVSEQGSLITTNGGWEYVIAKKGSYSYTSPEGKKISVHYIADHNGYRVIDDPNSV